MYVNIFFYSNMLKTKYKDVNLALLYTFLNVIHVILSDYIFKSLSYKYVEFFIMSFGFILIFYEGIFIKKMFVYIETIIITLLTELIGCQIVVAFLNISLEEMRGVGYIRNLVVIVCNIICSVFFIFILHLQKKIRFNLSTRKSIYILICFGIQIVACSVYNLTMIYNRTDLNQIFIVYVAISVLLDIYLLKIMMKMELKEETEQKIEYFQKQEALNAEYYADLAGNVNQLMALRNDYETELKKVYQFVGKDYHFSKQANLMRDTQQNVVVENIVATMRQRLESMGIQYDFNISIPKEVSIQALDLSSILTNLFDNAMEAIEKYRKTQSVGQGCDMVVNAGVTNDVLHICVENRKSQSDKVKKVGDSYVTTKTEKEIHGYGMKIIERIVKKYEGTMEVSYTDTWFKNQVRIPIIKKMI